MKLGDCAEFIMGQAPNSRTYNEIGEQRTWNPDNAYWINFRPFADERHWDNMGFEVLTSFPNVKLF